MSASARRRLQAVQDDSGQVATGLIICSLLALTAIAFWIMLPIGSAVNQKSGTQNAADASALAGADSVTDRVLVALNDLPIGPFTAPSVFSCALGAPDANRLAASNDARVTSYCYDWRSDRATVEVVADKALSGGQHSRARAVARTGVQWGSCHFTGLPSPSPSSSSTPSSSSSSSSAPPSPTSTAPAGPVDLVCGGITIRYDVRDGRLLLHDVQALRNMLKARLVD